jgi:hypothetical protein
MMANAGLTYRSGKPMAHYGRGFWSHLSSLYHEEKALSGATAAEAIASAYVDQNGHYAWDY